MSKVDRGIVFGSVFVQRAETEVLSVKLCYFVDFFFFEAFCGMHLPHSGDTFLKSFTFAFPDGKAFPCLAPKVVGFLVCFGLAGVFGGVFSSGFFSADLRGVTSGFLFVDGERFGVLAVAPEFFFFASLVVVSTGVWDWASVCFSWFIWFWRWHC